MLGDPDVVDLGGVVSQRYLPDEIIYLFCFGEDAMREMRAAKTPGFNVSTVMFVLITGGMAPMSVGAVTFTVTNDVQLSSANASAVGGDTIDIRSGVYSVAIAPAHSGASGTPITYRAHSGELVTISGSYDEITLPGSFIVVDGITFSNARHSWAWVDGEHNTIRNCTFRSTSVGSWGVRINGSYNTIQNNHFDGGECPGSCNDFCGKSKYGYGCPDDLIWMSDGASHNLLKENTFGKAAHYALNILSDCTFNVITANAFNNIWHSAIGFQENANFNLVDGNTIADGGEQQEYGPSSDCCRIKENMTAVQLYNSANNNIVRRNITSGNGNGYAVGSGDGPVVSNRIYNNVSDQEHFISNSWVPASAPPTRYNVFKNNSFSRAVGSSVRPHGLYWSIENVSRDVQSWVNNNWYSNAAHVYKGASGGDATIPENSSSGLNASFGSEFVNNLNIEPKFTDWRAHDYTLQASSPLIDAGDFLTSTTDSGADSKTLTVMDAGYFCDGWEIVEGDQVQLQDQTVSATITRVNYSTKQITVDKGLTWRTGQGVALAYSGAKPDIGAKEYQANTPVTPSLPSALRVR